MRLLLKFCLTTLLVIVSICNVLAQYDSTYMDAKSKKMRRTKAVYIEGLGSSGINYSINFDTRFKANTKGWGFRIGIARPTQSGRTEIFSFPLMLNKLSSNKKATLETGIGVLAVYRRLTYQDQNNIIHRSESVHFPASANIGFRLQPLRTGIVWRLYWCPNWNIGQSLNKPQLLWFGTSLGIGFK